MEAQKSDLGAGERERLSIRIAELEQALSPVPPAALQPIDPRVYFHIRQETQRESAQIIGKSVSENAFVVPGVQKLSFGPTNTELRYFRRTEKDEAEAIGVIIRSLGVPVNVVYVAGYEQSRSIRQRHYELWFSENPIIVKNK